MRTPSDPYADLGVPRSATQEEVTHAFRELLRRHHPDTRSHDGTSPADSDSTLLRVIAAYTALSERLARTQDPAQTNNQAAVVRGPSRGESATRDTIRAGPIRWTARR